MIGRTLIGARPADGEVGIWISKPGKDISSSDPDDFLFDPSKYMARAWARFVTSTFVRGDFSNTVTFGDGTKADYYYWDAYFYFPFGYVPMIIAQMGNELSPAASGLAGDCYFNASYLLVRSGSRYAWRYNAADPSKAPIPGTYWVDPVWVYDPATDTFSYVKGNNSNFIVYRNPLF